MSVIRYDIDKCVGCMRCFQVCPMDVFRPSEDGKKAVIAYPESCIVCGQCYVNCPYHSLALSGEAFSYNITSFRPVVKQGMNNKIYIP